MNGTTEISIDEYLSKRTIQSHDGIVYRAAKMPKSFDAETRSARFVMTDETTDSYGDIVKANGADLERFMANPICLLNHSSSRVIGTWHDVKQVKKSVEGVAKLALEGTSPHVDEAYALMSQGILRACSIGFMPKKVERRLDDNGEPLWSYIIHEWDLYECSIVSIPANPSALAKSIKEGHGMARDLLEQVLDEYVKTPAGLIIPRADFEAAHKEATGNAYSILAARLAAIEEKINDGIKVTITVGPDGKLKAMPNDPAPTPDPADEIQKSLNETVAASLAEFEPKVDEITSETRKSALKTLIDGIKSMLVPKAAEEPAPENTPETTQISDVKLTPEERAVILQRASSFATAD